IDEGYDTDFDGFTSCNGDCNDTNGAINPNVTELCNFVDDNCNFQIDEGFDTDFDTYTTCGGDCNDTNSAIHPGATETCNLVDDNCNILVDEGFTNETCQYTCLGYGFVWTFNGGSLNCCGNNLFEDSPYEIVETSCLDGNDNDCDGLVDLLDSDCPDTYPPKIYIITPSNGSSFNQTQSVFISVNVTDETYVSQVNVTVSIPSDGTQDLVLSYNAGTGLWDTTFTTTYNIGQYDFTVTASDNSSNTATADGHFDVVDVTPPLLIGASPLSGLYAVNSSLTFSVNVTDPYQENTDSVWMVVTLPDTSTVTLPMVLNASGLYTVPFIPGQTGIYNTVFYANDTSGNTASVSGNLTATVYPTAHITAPLDGTLFYQNDTINFTSTASDPDGSIVSYHWVSDLDGTLSSGQNFSFANLSVGNHTITLTVTDNLGAIGTDSINVLVALNTSPTVQIISPVDNASFFTSDVISFLGQAFDDGFITSVLWVSSISGNLSTSLSFSQSLPAGTHVITLYVTDNDNNTVWDSLIITVRVSSAPPGGGGGGGGAVAPAAEVVEEVELPPEEELPVEELPLEPERCIADGVCEPDCAPPDPDCRLREELRVEIEDYVRDFNIFDSRADMRVRVENTGEVPLGNIQLRISPEELFEDMDVSVGYLPPGGSRTVDVPLRADICEKDDYVNVPQQLEIEAEASSGGVSDSDSVTMRISGPSFIVKPKQKGDDIFVCIAFNNLDEPRRSQLEIEFDLSKEASEGIVDYFTPLTADADSIMVITKEYGVGSLPRGNFDARARLFEGGKLFDESYVIEEDRASLTLR
ncbi:TPA: PKD domain-containing protein, partial [Candidatus Woesearchaeota archaeon]|nr:PKD domain-containing protein [Candidatus Woesearchaeota archaeon]